VAWRKPVEPPHIEPPEWYRTYHPESWDEPDGQEQAMIDGCPSMRPWPDDLHHHHAQRRWHEAKYRYRQEHPDLAEQEFQAIVSGEWRSREAERDSPA
jgi:hypothetical protein